MEVLKAEVRAEAKAESVAVLGVEGWDVEGDELKGFDGAAIFKDDLKASYREPRSVFAVNGGWWLVGDMD